MQHASKMNEFGSIRVLGITLRLEMCLSVHLRSPSNILQGSPSQSSDRVRSQRLHKTGCFKCLFSYRIIKQTNHQTVQLQFF